MLVLAVIVAVLFVAAMTRLSRDGFGMFDDLDSDPSDAYAVQRQKTSTAQAFEQDSHIGFGAIRHSDPAFDLEAFYARVTEMFLAYHAAFDERDLGPARRFIDERYYPVLADRLDAAGPATGATPLVVEHARALTATREDGMDRIRVLFTAAASGNEEKLQEYWTLIRGRGVVTKAGLSVHKCANCGAPTDGKDPTHCAYCGARLADPALDWVVARIDAD